MDTMPVTADLSLMRQLNQALILNLVRQAGQISRADIAKRTNLSRSTVSNIINELINEQRIFEVQKGESRGGRRPILLELNYRSRFAIGIEIATRFLNLVITDLKAVIIYHHSEPFDTSVGPDETVDRVRQLVMQALRAADVARAQVAGIGIGVPGPLAYATSQTIAPPIMPGWSGVSLRDCFAAVLPFPVMVDNDANLGALAEYRWGVAQGIRNVAYLYLGTTGIGAGLVINGAIYRGEIGSAGEIGHLTIDEDGPPCSCGSFGCLEAVAGLPHLLECATTFSGDTVPTLEWLLEQARNGNQDIRDLFAESGTHLGVAIASLLNLYNPGLVVVGGPLSRARGLLLDNIRLIIKSRALPISVEHCEVVLGQLELNAVALGAASQIIQTVFSPASFDMLVGQL